MLNRTAALCLKPRNYLSVYSVKSHNRTLFLCFQSLQILYARDEDERSFTFEKSLAMGHAFQRRTKVRCKYNCMLAKGLIKGLILIWPHWYIDMASRSVIVHYVFHVSQRLLYPCQRLYILFLYFCLCVKTLGLVADLKKLSPSLLERGNASPGPLFTCKFCIFPHFRLFHISTGSHFACCNVKKQHPSQGE